MKGSAFAAAARGLGLLVLLVSACSQFPVRPPLPPGATEPIVKQRRLAPTRGALDKIAFAGVEPASDLRPFAPRVAPTPNEVSALMGELLLEALAAEGFTLVPPSELRRVLSDAETAADTKLPELASLAAAATGATGLLVARLDRWRDREGGAASVKSPASVALEASLYSARGRRIWTGIFSETQHSSNYRPARAARYPGRGTRWLTAEDLARWGALHIARALRESRDH